MVNTQRLADLIAYSIIDEWVLEHREMEEFKYRWFNSQEIQQVDEYRKISAVVEQIINRELDDLGIEYTEYKD
jgi:hypothetical protein